MNWSKIRWNICTKQMRGSRKTHVEKQRKSLLVSDWEWLPNAVWHPKVGNSCRILLFLIIFIHESYVSLSCAWWKRYYVLKTHHESIKNRQTIAFSLCAQDSVEKRLKTAKIQMCNQHLGVNQLLGVTPNCWASNCFLYFSLWNTGLET